MENSSETAYARIHLYLFVPKATDAPIMVIFFCHVPKCLKINVVIYYSIFVVTVSRMYVYLVQKPYENYVICFHI